MLLTFAGGRGWDRDGALAAGRMPFMKRTLWFWYINLDLDPIYVLTLFYPSPPSANRGTFVPSSTRHLLGVENSSCFPHILPPGTTSTTTTLSIFLPLTRPPPPPPPPLSYSCLVFSLPGRPFLPYPIHPHSLRPF